MRRREAEQASLAAQSVCPQQHHEAAPRRSSSPGALPAARCPGRRRPPRTAPCRRPGGGRGLRRCLRLPAGALAWQWRGGRPRRWHRRHGGGRGRLLHISTQRAGPLQARGGAGRPEARCAKPAGAACSTAAPWHQTTMLARHRAAALSGRLALPGRCARRHDPFRGGG